MTSAGAVRPILGRVTLAGPSPIRTAAARPLRSSWLDVAGMRIHTVAGGEGPPVVLVHGYGVSGTYMLPLAKVLVSSCSVLVPDLPGQGKSAPLYRGPSIAFLADVLGTCLDVAGVSSPVVVANSMGCQIATELAVRRPDHVRALVLVGPTVDPARRAARHQLFGLLRESAREPFSLVTLAARDNASVGVRPLLAAARSALCDRIEDRLPQVEQPTFVVHGENDGFLGREWAERVAALLPDSRLVVVPGEAHAVHYTQPELVAEIAVELLRTS
jgi:2-hydroxy-6-oxonona-2,4-dienedioate hydrolase